MSLDLESSPVWGRRRQPLPHRLGHRNHPGHRPQNHREVGHQPLAVEPEDDDALHPAVTDPRLEHQHLVVAVDDKVGGAQALEDLESRGQHGDDGVAAAIGGRRRADC
jgi:hypothetical protein